MTASKKDNRRFQSGRGMFGKGATYKCHCCGRMTRETGLDESSLDLCAYCLEESYLENSLSDGNIEQEQFDADLDKLQKAYKRGKYAVEEADKKVRLNPAGPSAAEVNVAVTKLVKELKANAPAIAKVLKQVDTQSKPVVKDMVSVRLGYGIVRVLALDDASMIRSYGLEIDSSKKSFITVTASRKDMTEFADVCDDRNSTSWDQPLWYMAVAKAAAIKVRAALGGK